MGKNEAELKQAFDESRELFVALGDRYRQDILLILGEDNETAVKDLAKRLGLSRPATSHHIKVLKDVGLLGERTVGVRTYYYPMVAEPFRLIKRLIDLVEHHDGLVGQLHDNQTKGRQ